MPEFRRSRNEMDTARVEATGATACLSGRDMKLVQQRAAKLRAVPQFNAFDRALEAANQFALRAQAAPIGLVAIDEVGRGADAQGRATTTDRRECFAPERGPACSATLLLAAL
jgi:hypothetical protein